MLLVLPLAPPREERRRTRSEIISQTGLGPRAKDVLASSQRCGVRHRGFKRYGPVAPKCALVIPKAGSKSSEVRNYSQGYIEQAPRRGHEASPQSGLVLGCMLCSSSKKLRGLGVRTQARSTGTSLLFSVFGVSSFLSPPRSAMRCGAWECNAGSR